MVQQLSCFHGFKSPLKGVFSPLGFCFFCFLSFRFSGLFLLFAAFLSFGVSGGFPFACGASLTLVTPSPGMEGGGSGPHSKNSYSALGGSRTHWTPPPP